MGVDKKRLSFRTLPVSRPLPGVVALIAIVSSCYGMPRIGGSGAKIGGADGGVGGSAGADGGLDSTADRDSESGMDGGGDTNGAICAADTKVCDGRCIPVVACCGPCSCEELPPTCGPNRDEDCCSSVLVTGGTFNRDNDSAYPATVGDFHLDRFEITVGRFNQFIAARQGLQSTAPQTGSGKNALDPSDPGWDASWNTYLATTAQALATNIQCPRATFLSGDDVLPINCITWYEAYAFCIWDGGRLPTEAEWTYAAVGGGLADGQRAYPWSMPPSSVTVDSTYSVYSVKVPAEVGSRSPKGDGKWTQADLVGNVGEWLADYVGAYPVPCYNCANRVVGERRVIRGGDWGLPALENTLSQAHVIPDAREGLYGARCARR
jgi:sulfatase modifying factor 1